SRGSEDIVAQIFDPSGNVVGIATFSGAASGDRIISGTGTNAAGALSGGGFVLAWDGDHFPDQNIGTIGFSATGQVTSSWASLSGGGPGTDIAPVITPLANGGYALTWSDTGQLITETFDAQGLATTPLTHLTTGGAEQNPAHAAQADGYALAWADFSNPGGAQIFFAGFDANGEEIGTPVDITADLPPIYVGFLNPKMAALSDGN